jgi:predicted XRE-type DNA-binding protein
MAIEAQETLIEAGSGNVFADLGLSNPEERLSKARLASAILDALEARGFDEAQAANHLGVDAASLARLRQGRLADFPAERLLRFLLSVGLDVDIVVHRELPAEDRMGAVTIAYA